MSDWRAQWIIADRSMATIGDLVELLKPANVTGVIIGVDSFSGAPTVEITEGGEVGKTFAVWPTTIARQLKHKS